ncbi:MAG: type I glyceraldehyde-3-phosphate dehydrogenase [Candidatus Levybacteria bacterium]|nr:type I glyceraldehyde-3-phosphate dehydrogenase [Candidatus Levybacteria bacterium]
MVRVAINGYGRIGRVAHRVILQKHASEIEVVAINAGSSTDIKGWMYLLKYDTTYGPLSGHSIECHPELVSGSQIKGDSDFRQNDNGKLGSLIVDGKEIPVFSQKDPTLLPWKDLNVDVVIESTGHFLTQEKLQSHLTAGAKKVVLSAPAKGGEIATYVLSVNDKSYKGESLINNASCTTNCITPVARIMVDNFGVEKAMMTTIHGYTSDQKLQDGGHKDYRRARAAAQNIVPTSTGATIAAAEAIPELKGIFNGLALRVPVVTGSLSDFTFLLKRSTTKEEINEIFKKEALNPVYNGILEVTEDPIVSSDIVGNSHSSIVDLSFTQVVGGNMVKVIAWYDNEFGYANRLVEEVIMVGKQV